MSHELSHALPAYFYSDPSCVVERQQLEDLGCKACASHHCYCGKVVCTDVRVSDHKKVPTIGTKCRYFDLKV